MVDRTSDATLHSCTTHTGPDICEASNAWDVLLGCSTASVASYENRAKEMLTQWSSNGK